jgi:hypothetical protein
VKKEVDVSTIEKPLTLEGNGSVVTSQAPMAVASEPEGLGWVVFSALMLGFAGAWSTLVGILAIGQSKVFVANATFVFSDLRTWGWIVLALGVLTLIAAFALMSGSELARWFGIAVAGLNAVGQLLFVQAYPWWSMAIFAVDILVIYGLAAYAGARLRQP